MLRIDVPIIDSELASKLQRGFDEVIRSRDAQITRVRVDIGKVSAMCSGGFEALLLLHRACKDAGIGLVFSQPTAEFQQLLSRMGFLRLLSFEGV